MTRKLRIYAEAPEPEIVDGVSYCASQCRHYAVRLCALTGFRAGLSHVCEPAFREMAAELDELRRESDGWYGANLTLAEATDALERERDALRAEVERLRSNLMDYWAAHGGVTADVGVLRAEALRLECELLKAEVARKVEPLSDEERQELWSLIDAHHGSTGDDLMRASAAISDWLDRLQGRGGET